MKIAADRLPPVSFPSNLFADAGEEFPVTRTLVDLLARRPGPRSAWDSALAELDGRLEVALAASYGNGDPVALQDVQQGLFVIYETSFANPLSAACEHERSAWLADRRGRIEATWMDSDLASLNVPSGEECIRMDAEEVRNWFLRTAAEESQVDRDVVRYLENDATIEDFRQFVSFDAHLNYRFYDSLVLSLVHYSEVVKTEISEHFWEESGEGDVEQSHTRQFTRSLERIGAEWEHTPGWDDWRPYAGYNLYFCLGLSRRHYFKALGNLAMPELFDVERDQAIVNGLARLGFDPERDFEYFWNHVEADAEHGPAWLDGVVLPIAEAQPEAIHELIVGAALRMQAMRRFNAFLAERFGLAEPPEVPAP